MLPLVLADLGGSEAEAGVIRAIVGVGAVLGFLLARRPTASAADDCC